MTIGKIVQETRRQEGLTLEKMGEALGVTRQVVHQWEKGKSLPGLSLLLTTAMHNQDWRRDFALKCLDVHPGMNKR